MILEITLTAVFAIAAGITTYFVARRDLRPIPAAGVAVAATLLEAAGFWFTLYLAVVAYVMALVVWLVGRRLLSNRQMALLAGGATFAVVIVGLGSVLYYAVGQMN